MTPQPERTYEFCAMPDGCRSDQPRDRVLRPRPDHTTIPEATAVPVVKEPAPELAYTGAWELPLAVLGAALILLGRRLLRAAG